MRASLIARQLIGASVLAILIAQSAHAQNGFLVEMPAGGKPEPSAIQQQRTVRPPVPPQQTSRPEAGASAQPAAPATGAKVENESKLAPLDKAGQ